MKKKSYKKTIVIFLMVLLFSFCLGRITLYIYAEKINPYETVEFSGSEGRYVFKKHGNHCFVTASNPWMGIDEKEKAIPKFVYYAVVLRMASMGIENCTGYVPDGLCVDGFICHIKLDRKDGTCITHVTYEYDFPPREKINRLYKFISAVDNKRLIRHMCTEISHTKKYREIKYKIYDTIREIKKKYNK